MNLPCDEIFWPNYKAYAFNLEQNAMMMATESGVYSIRFTKEVQIQIRNNITPKF